MTSTSTAISGDGAASRSTSIKSPHMSELTWWWSRANARIGFIDVERGPGLFHQHLDSKGNSDKEHARQRCMNSCAKPRELPPRIRRHAVNAPQEVGQEFCIGGIVPCLHKLFIR